MNAQQILATASLVFAVACDDSAPAADAPASERSATADASTTMSRNNLPRTHVEPGTVPVIGSSGSRCDISAVSSKACARGGIATPAGFVPDGRFAPEGVMARVEAQAESRQVPPRISSLPRLSDRESPVVDRTKGGAGRAPDLHRIESPATGLRCTVSPDGWLDTPEAWADVSVRLGEQRIGQVDAIRFLDGPTDDGFAELAAQAVAAELNLARGIEVGPVAEALADAHALLSAEDDGLSGRKGRCSDEVCELDEEVAFELAHELADFNLDFCE